MVGVVVIDLRAVEGALVLEAAAGAGEGCQSRGDGLAGDAQHVGGGGCGQRVGDVVGAGDVQGHVGVGHAVDDHVEVAVAVEEGDVVGVAVRAPILYAEGEHRVGQTLHGLPRALVIGVGDDIAPLGHQRRKVVEGVLDVRQILEEIQMVGVDVQYHRHGGEEVQEGVAVFAALQNDGVALAHPVAGVEQRQRAADHHRGVGLRRHEDVGGHGGGGGLAVGAGHAQGVAVALHDGAPRLGALVYGDAPRHSAGDLRVVVVNGGGADHRVAVFQVLRRMAYGHGNAHGAQVLHGGAVGHVGALHRDAHALQHLGQRAHGHAADARQMDALAGLDILVKVLDGMEHRSYLLDRSQKITVLL